MSDDATSCADCGGDAVLYVAEAEDGPERPMCDDCIDGLGRWWPRRVPGKRGRPRRCRDCWAIDGHRGTNVEPRRTWGLYPSDIRRRKHKPAICDDCWAERERHAPEKPPFGEPRNDHEPTHEGERCLSCGAEGVIPTRTLGTPRAGAVVYACADCGEYQMDDLAYEWFRWSDAAGEAVAR